MDRRARFGACRRRVEMGILSPLLAALAVALVAGPAAIAQGPPKEAGIFTDGTAASGLDFHHFNGMSGELYFVEMNGAGAAVLDYDGDDDLDLFLVQGAMLGPGRKLSDATLAPRSPLPLRDRLYRNELVPTGRLRFTDVTDDSGIDSRGYGMGVATGDVDNDGWTDLYVTNFGPNRLFLNNGDGTFREITEQAGAGDDRWSVSATFLDFDRDGRLDLFVTNYVDFTFDSHQTCRTVSGSGDYCGPLAYHSEPDRLLRNLGPGSAPGAGTPVRFEDYSTRAGIAETPGAALGVASGDFNGDGWPDVYVANDQMRNFMWINQTDAATGERFRDEALMAGTAVNEQGNPEASMGIAVGDFDNDGDEDLFMTHLTRETNTLYANDGGGFFDDATIAAALGPPSWEYTGFGTGFLDFDNDGWLDLLAVNGAVRLIEAQVAAGDPHPLRQRNLLFHNRAGSGFEEVGDRAGEVFALSEVSRGAAFGDLDNDGDTDVVVTNNAGPARLLINQVGQERHWLGLRLRDASGKREIPGARVAVQRPGRPTLWRRAGTGGSYASAGDPRVLVGLGDDPRVSGVEVHWPDGQAESWVVTEVDRYLTLRRGTGTAR